MNVLHLSNSDISGGAAIAAFRLHDALRNAGLTSSMAVGSRRSGDPDVLAMRQPASRAAWIWRRLGQMRLLAARRLSTRQLSPALDYFSDDRVAGPDPLANLPQADVLHLHWVAHLVDYTRFFKRLRPGQPLVWTLHDMNPFTGGCHYTMGCDRFLTGCGACPMLGSTRTNDITRGIFARKKAALARLDPRTSCIVAPSRWLADEARQSPLMDRFRIEVVANGIDTDSFRPRDRRVAREVFGLPQEGRVVLFVADSLGNYRKGFDLLAEALSDLPAQQPVTLATIGGTHQGGVLDGDVVALGRVESPRLMSFAYSAADLFVLPTRADNLPNVALEAMACGTPVIGFDVGGVPDMVRPGETGLLAPLGDVAAMRNAIRQLLEDDALRERLSRTCREVAVAEYGAAMQAGRYAKIYDSLISGSEMQPARH